MKIEIDNQILYSGVTPQYSQFNNLLLRLPKKSVFKYKFLLSVKKYDCIS